MKETDISITDNRMEWNLKRKNMAGVIISWGLEPVLVDTDGMILPKEAEFYENGDWPTCPITGIKIPIAK